MIRFNCLFVLVGFFQVIYSQGPPGFPPGGPHGFENIPEKCRRPPQGVENPEQCCQIEPMFTEEDLSSCGFKKVEGENYKDRRGPPDCSKPLCLLKLKGLLDESNQIKWPDVELFIDEQVKSRSSEGTAQVVKEICVKPGEVPGPPHVCEHARLMYCVGGVMFGNCPEEKWMQTDSCSALKDHMETCKASFQ